MGLRNQRCPRTEGIIKLLMWQHLLKDKVLKWLKLVRTDRMRMSKKMFEK
jgi:hypothetical protein